MFDNNKFAMSAGKSAGKALKYIQESGSLIQPTIGADRYNSILMEDKLEKDASFLVSLSEQLEESTKDLFFKDLEILLENTKLLFEEVNMKPRTCSRQIDSGEITESVQLGLYEKHMTDSITKDFTQPLFEGTLIQDNNDNVKLLMEASISANLTGEIDNELFLKYAIFENTICANIKDIVLPKILEERTATFIGVQEKEYFEIFENSADKLLSKIEESSTSIGSKIAPALFIGGLEEGTDITIDSILKFAGISAAIK